MVDMVNEEDGWKNLLFRAEYGYWYRFILPAFKRLGFPIPLSGTTCFFRRGVLESVSDKRRERKGSPWESSDEAWLFEHSLLGITPWDPKNVTEDFELGLQLWASNYDFGIIDSVTKEESPQTLENWMKQRTRWQKGKVFTFLDFFKHRAGTSMGERAHLLWQSFLPHAGPLNVTGLLLLIGIGSALGFVPPNAFVSGILTFGFLFLFAGVLSFAAGYWLTSKKPPMHKLSRAIFVAATTPLYWVLQWAADIRAFKQLAVGDLGWEKTVHENHGRLEQLQQDPAETDSLPGQIRAKAMNNLLLWPILLLALGLRIPGLDRSLWIDEVYSVTERGSEGFVGIITTIADPHPPLYYLTLHGWMQVFGRSPLAVRSLSLILGIASIAAVYLLGRELYDKRTGLVAALLLSLSTFHIQYSQTARMYTMLVFFGTLSLLFYVRCLKDHSLDNRAGYAVTTVGMLLTHPYGSFVFLGQLLHLCIWLYQQPKRQMVKQWAGTQTLAVMPFVPWLGLVAFQRYLFGSDTETRWLSTVGFGELRDVGLAFVGVPVNYPTLEITSYTYIVGQILIVGVLVAVLWNLYSEWNADSEIRGATLLSVLLVALVGIPFAISATVFPFFDIRYVIVGLVAVTVLVAKSVSSIDYSTARIAATVMVVLASVSMLPVYYGAEHSEPWNEAVSTIEQQSDNALVVTVPSFTQRSLNYYISNNSSVETVRYTSTEDIRERLSSGEYDSLWVVVRTRGPGREPIEWSMPSGYEPVQNESLGRLDLVKYEVEPSDSTANQTAEVDG
jgi:4-amino-4-deoxy-L-arabinose transferase-like glycosyltransferase